VQPEVQAPPAQRVLAVQMDPQEIQDLQEQRELMAQLVPQEEQVAKDPRVLPELREQTVQPEQPEILDHRAHRALLEEQGQMDPQE